MNGFFYARGALELMGCIAGVVLIAAALVWCIAALWIEFEPDIRAKLDERDRRRRQDPVRTVEIRTDWRR